eukprot:COSAG01_NODE_1685_length_9495_cov_61.609728_6_plen_53_part_00
MTHGYNLRKIRDPLLKYWGKLPQELLSIIYVLSQARRPRRPRRILSSRLGGM